MTDITQCPQSALLINGTLPEALSFVKKLFGSQHEAKIEGGQHPDVHHYVPEGKSGLHPIVNIRKIIEETALPPTEAPCKVFIIEEAEKMLPSSSNALLKTLEEPRDDICFFLLTHHPKQLLDTIRSRLYPITFEAKGEGEVLAIDSFMEKVKNEEWDLLLEELPDGQIDPFLQGILHSAKNGRDFRKALSLIEHCQKAKDHNIKERNILLHYLISASLSNPT